MLKNVVCAARKYSDLMMTLKVAFVMNARFVNKM